MSRKARGGSGVKLHPVVRAGLIAGDLYGVNIFNEPVPEWRGNRLLLTTDNHDPVAPIAPDHADAYICLPGWSCLGWTTAPWASRTGCPTCIVFEHDDGRKTWAHCIPQICIRPNARDDRP